LLNWAFAFASEWQFNCEPKNTPKCLSYLSQKKPILTELGTY